MAPRRDTPSSGTAVAVVGVCLCVFKLGRWCNSFETTYCNISHLYFYTVSAKQNNKKTWQLKEVSERYTRRRAGEHFKKK